MSIPVQPVPVPAAVTRLAAGCALAPAWRNGLGGVTFTTEDGRYIRFDPHSPELDPDGEVARLAWAAPFTAVPRVLAHGGDGRHSWLVTAAIPGRSAVDPRWIAEPETAVPAVGRGLRMLHDALPVDTCPFDWGVAHRVARAGARGIHIPDPLRTPPPVDRAVVCHGDACCPNTLLDDHGDPVAHVDLGALGVADRWADIAVAAMSTEWNYGPGWADTLIDAYGVAPDRDRLSYYRALWNAT